MTNATQTLSRGQKAAQTRAANAAALARAEAAAQLAKLPTPEQVEQEAAAAAAEEAANLAAEAAAMADEAKARAGYTGPMLKLRERLKAGKYVKAANGQPCCGDAIATAFGALTPAQTIASCIVALGIGYNPYLHLNIGQQSMNLRNKLRNALKRGEFGFGVVTEAIEEATGVVVDVNEDDGEESDSEE